MIKNERINIVLASIFCLIMIMPSAAHAHESSPDFDYYGNEETGWWIKEDCHFGEETLTYWIDRTNTGQNIFATPHDPRHDFYMSCVTNGAAIWNAQGFNQNGTDIIKLEEVIGIVAVRTENHDEWGNLDTYAYFDHTQGTDENNHLVRGRIIIFTDVLNENDERVRENPLYGNFVLAHEFGHAFGLKDLEEEYNAGRLMKQGEVNRTFTEQDKWGLKIIRGEHTHSSNFPLLYDESCHYNGCTNGCGLIINTEPHSVYCIQNDDNATHTKHCEVCDFVLTRSHRLTVWEINPENISEHMRYCTDCGFIIIENHNIDTSGGGRRCINCPYDENPDLCEHIYGPWSNESRTCVICGQVQTCSHTYGEWENGNRPCTICGHIQTCIHIFNTWKDGGSLTHYRNCIECGTLQTRQHDYSPWSKNGSYHDKSCYDCGRGVSGTHTYGSWASDGSGGHTRSCITCEYSQSEPHNGNWTYYNNSYHRKTCGVCGTLQQENHNISWNIGEANHSGTCSVCGKKISADHSYGEWTSDGSSGHSRSCTFCGYAQTGSHYGDWMDAGQIYHRRTCDMCSYLERGLHIDYWTGTQCGLCGRTGTIVAPYRERTFGIDELE